MLYSITHRFSGQVYSQIIKADDADSAYVQYTADPGDYTNSDDEPYDAEDLIIIEVGGDLDAEDGEDIGTAVEPTTVRCECGRWSGEPCQWTGPVEETAIVEWMPEHLRASHTAANNRGVYPLNGAERLRVERSCADRMIEDSGDWARQIEPGEPAMMSEPARSEMTLCRLTRREAEYLMMAAAVAGGWIDTHPDSRRAVSDAIGEGCADILALLPEQFNSYAHRTVSVEQARAILAGLEAASKPSLYYEKDVVVAAAAADRLRNAVLFGRFAE